MPLSRCRVVHSNGTSSAAGREFSFNGFNSGDTVTVQLDMDAGTISWSVSGRDATVTQSNVKGPVRQDDILVLLESEREARRLR